MRNVLLVLPTGGGKTCIATELVRASTCKNKRIMFICHRQELLSQTYKTFLKNDITPAIIKSGIKPDYDNKVQIALINTLAKRLDKVIPPDVIFWDECQHIASSTWSRVAKLYKNAYHIGLSATPCRLDGKSLGTFFEGMVNTITTKGLIELGFLSKFLYYAPSRIDTKGIKIKSNGDYDAKMLENASFSSVIIGDNIEQYKKIADGKRNIVFAINRNHGKLITKRYNEAGIPAEFVDGETQSNLRKKAIENFETGKTKVLVNVDLFGEGFDLPAIEVVSLLRPTASTSLFLQQVGRALRPSAGKEYAIILDHVCNYETHGFPDDMRDWSLTDGLKKKKRKQEQSTVSIRRCPNCFFAHKPALKCPNCGYIYSADGKIIKEVAGELYLVGTPEYKRAQIIHVENFADLVQIENERGYSKHWAEKQWKVKTGEDLWGSLDGLEKIESTRGYKRGWAWLTFKRRQKNYGFR